MCRTPREGSETTEEGLVTPCIEGQSGDRIQSQQEKAPVYWLKRLALGLIRFYQNVISPRTPPTCFFYPTCSHYTYQAIERFGFWRGAWLGALRIGRCHPFARGGYDPVPERFLWFPKRQRPEESCPEVLYKDLDE